MSATGFSYAQAARGQPTTPGAAITSPSATTSHVSSQDKASEVSTASASQPEDASSPPADTAKSAGSPPSPRKPASDLPASPATSSTLVGTTAESSSNFSLDEGASQSASTDKPIRVAAQDAHSSLSDDMPRKGSRKPKAASKGADKDAVTSANGDADKEAEADAPKIELAPAPVPAVNIWSQRMIQHAAKVKPQAAASAKSASVAASRPAASVTPTNGTKSKDGKKTGSSGADMPDASGTVSTSAKPASRRPNENVRPGADQARRNGPRGARSTDKDEKTVATNLDSLPSVHDATSWPTPESSLVVDDAKTKAAMDKPDAADKDVADESGSLKSRKKGWVHMPFVPTVNFQTPIPTARGSKLKPSARTTTRDPTSRGTHTNGAPGSTATADKAAPAVSSPVDGKQISEARDVAREAANSTVPAARLSSTQATTSNKRGPAEASNGHSRETRKPLPSSLPEKPKDSLDSQHQAGPKVVYAANTHMNGEFNNQLRHTAHHSHGERRASFAPKNGENKEGHTHSSRPDQRPGRGGFRGGRGGGPAQNQHLGHSYQPNGKMASSASHNPNNSTLPPTAAPFNPPAHQLPPSQQFYGNGSGATRSAGRMSGRSQAASQPAVVYGGRAQHSGHRMYMYPSHGANAAPGEYQAQPYSFSAFSPYMDNELLHGLILQVEYYFSLDNLCKDFFLRKQMNDQGFVPLSTIAKFKRMSELAPSVDFIRAACEQSEHLDYVMDQENEWIRSRQLWGNFVLPPDERNEDARKPGPDLRTAYFRSAHSRLHQTYGHSMMSGGYPTMQQAMYMHNGYPINGQEMHYNAGYNGHADYTAHAGSSNGESNRRSHKAADSQLSASVPDFAPGGPVRGGGAPMTLEDYQTYPDEQVEKLVVPAGSDSESVQAQQNGSSSANGAFLMSLKDGEEPYAELRSRALDQRASAKAGETPDAMVKLYQFWSQCLPDKFNVRMYEDFRTFALEDARGSTPVDFGLKCLVQYYNQILFGSSNTRPYPAVFGPHHTEAMTLFDPSKMKAATNDGQT